MKSKFIFYSFICLALTGALSSCGKSSCNTDNNQPPKPPSPAQNLTLVLSSPQSYPAGMKLTMPAIITNVGAKTLKNIIYSISNNNTNSNITIDETTSSNCSTIAVGQSCQLNILIPAQSQAGSFDIQASNSLKYKNIQSTSTNETFSASTVTGLTDVPSSDLAGINGVAFYYPRQILDNGIILITMVVNSPNTGAFNTLNLVDAAGQTIPYQVLTGNSGNGLNNLSVGDVVTLSVQIPSGTNKISVYPELLKNGNPANVPSGSSYKAQNPISVSIVSSASEFSEPHGIIQPISQNISFESTNTSQKITIKNDGDLPITNLTGTFPNITPQPFTFGEGSTCGSTLQPQEACYYVVNFDSSVKTAGTDSLNISYNDGTADRNSIVSFTYRGTDAIAGLSTGTERPVAFNSTTTSPSVSQTITFTNNGQTPITLDGNNTIDLPNSNFSHSNAPDGLTTCSANLVLAVGGSCSVTVTYNSDALTQNNQGDIQLNYHFTDIDGITQLSGSGIQTVSWDTIVGQGILNMPTTYVNFSESHTSQTITINNSGNSIITDLTANLPSLSPQPFTISSDSTCGSQLRANDSCSFIINFDSSVHIAGTDVLTISYNDGQGSNSQTSTFSYRGAQVRAGLEITSPNNSNFDYTTTTNDPIESNLVFIKNTGEVPIQLNGTPIELPSDKFSYAPAPEEYTSCTNNINLNVGELCAIYIVYNNNSVTSEQQSGNISVDYNFTDIDGSTTVTASSVIATTWSTAQSQGIISSSSGQLNFGNILNNNVAESTLDIKITNTGDANIPSLTPSISGDNYNIYSITNNGCTNGLNAGESCSITVKVGPIESTITELGPNYAFLNTTYTPYIGASSPMSTTNLVLLNTQVANARSALINVSNAALTSPETYSGDGSIETPYAVNSRSATLSYTVTNSGEVPASNFRIVCGGSEAIAELSSNSNSKNYMNHSLKLSRDMIDMGEQIIIPVQPETPDDQQAQQPVSTGWVIDSSECTGILTGACTVTVTKPRITRGSNNYFPNCTMYWNDEDSPNGQNQQFSLNTVYVVSR